MQERAHLTAQLPDDLPDHVADETTDSASIQDVVGPAEGWRAKAGRDERIAAERGMRIGAAGAARINRLKTPG